MIPYLDEPIRIDPTASNARNEIIEKSTQLAQASEANTQKATSRIERPAKKTQNKTSQINALPAACRNPNERSNPQPDVKARSRQRVTGLWTFC